MNAQSPLTVTDAPRAERIAFAADVARLVGHLHLPAARPRAAAVLHPATGVDQKLYQPFAAWLAGQGIACLTYDYRDFGASARGPVRRSGASLVDWGLRDQAAAQVALERRLPGVPVWVIGHSIGGLMLPFQPGADRVSRLITVAAGPVHFSDHPAKGKVLAAALWWGHGAAAAALAGYLPGRALGLGSDIPIAVYRDWRRWCTTRGFHLGDVGRRLPVPDFRAFQGDMRVVAISDDWMVPPAAVWRTMQLYPEAAKRQRVLNPGDLGLGHVGHIGVFRRRNAALWPEILG